MRARACCLCTWFRWLAICCNTKDHRPSIDIPPPYIYHVSFISKIPQSSFTIPPSLLNYSFPITILYKRLHVRNCSKQNFRVLNELHEFHSHKLGIFQANWSIWIYMTYVCLIALRYQFKTLGKIDNWRQTNSISMLCLYLEHQRPDYAQWFAFPWKTHKRVF